jgi:hypothetical protein
MKTACFGETLLVLLLAVPVCAIMLSAGCMDSAGSPADNNLSNSSFPASPGGDNLNSNPYTVPVETAYNQTLSTFWSYPREGPDVINENWTSASLDPEPTIIYDVNGEPLYYEFYVRDAQGISGYSWTAANKLLGIPVFRIYPGAPSWNHSLIAQDAENIVKTQYPGYTILSDVPALYSGDYLSLCRMLVIQNSSSGSRDRIIVDAFTLEIIPDDNSTSYNSHKYAFSFLDSVPQSKYSDHIDQWEMQNSFDSRIVEYAVAQGGRLPLSEQNASNIRKYRTNLSDLCLQRVSPGTNKTYGPQDAMACCMEF